MKKTYVSPLLQQEFFETADVITSSSMMFINAPGAANDEMPDVNVLQNHFRD